MLNGLLQHTFIIQVYVAKHPLLYCISVLLNSSVPISMGWNVTVINLWPIWPFLLLLRGKELVISPIIANTNMQEMHLSLLILLLFICSRVKKWIRMLKHNSCCFNCACQHQRYYGRKLDEQDLTAVIGFFINSNDIFLIRMCRKSCKSVLKINLP